MTAHPVLERPLRGPDGRFLKRAPEPRRDLLDPTLFINQELSWLAYHRRVLEVAGDPELPLLERLRFVTLFAENLDEFFMVRVSGLHEQVAAGLGATTADGMTPAAQLEAIAEQLPPTLEEAAHVVHELLLPLLGRHGVVVTAYADLHPRARERLDAWFQAEVFPVLTPLAVDPGHPFPYISNLSLSLVVTAQDPDDGWTRFARVKVPASLPRFVHVPDSAYWVPLEEVIAAHRDQLFPGVEVLGSWPFRVTRDTDLDVVEDEADDLLAAVEQTVSRRRFGNVVRLEVSARMPAGVVERLQEELDLPAHATFAVRGLLGLDDLRQLAELDLPRLRLRPFTPAPHPRLRPRAVTQPLPADELFTALRQGDVLVRHPYTSFQDTVERFLEAAAEDPDVLAIKQTLYRTTGDSPIVQALIRAAEAGKQVAVVVELQARFDEAANIASARALERVGAHVVYGLLGLKTHAKVALVVRREAGGLRRYVHIGTGNYHPAAARSWVDVGLLSARRALGEDLTDLFNQLTGYARTPGFRRILAAPSGLREHLRALIAEQARRGRKGRIRVKLNALTDPVLIADLYAASRAGVPVDAVVRAVCTLRPGMKGVSERIRVRSIVGRLLEHERILQFGDRVWIGSADWMPRNLDRRVEVVVPVEDDALAAELRAVLDTCLADTQQAWSLQADGSWVRVGPRDGARPVASQSVFAEHASRRGRTAPDTGGSGSGATREPG